MDTLSVLVEQTRDDSEIDDLRAGMRRHTEQHVPWETYDEVTVVLRDQNRRFLGAALGRQGVAGFESACTQILAVANEPFVLSI